MTPKVANALKDDAEANNAYFKLYEEAMAAAEKEHKNRPANS
jgi:hypothetical protein